VDARANTENKHEPRMELLKEVAPNTKRVAIIFNPQHFDDELTYARKGAESLGIDATAHPIKNTGELDAALRAVGANQANSLFVIPSRLTRIVAPISFPHVRFGSCVDGALARTF